MSVKKIIRICMHLLLWFMLPFLITLDSWIRQPAFFISQSKSPPKSYFSVFADNLLLSMLAILIGSIGFYVTFYLIAPSYLNKRKSRLWGYLLLWFSLPFVIVYTFSTFSLAFSWFFEIFLLVAYILLLIFSMLGALLQTYNFGQKKKREKEVLEKKQMESQLVLLKSKIDPHFLFNTINNIDVLIETRPLEASNFLKKLSEILRFVLYRTNVDKIPLTEEVNYIQKYIELERIRSFNQDFVNFEVSGITTGRFIAPMILIIFVENAIKFVADRKINNAIQIFLNIKEDQLEFCVINTVGQKALLKNKDNGIGLSSVKQRLRILYGEHHQLKITSEVNQFKVELILKGIW